MRCSRDKTRESESENALSGVIARRFCVNRSEFTYRVCALPTASNKTTPLSRRYVPAKQADVTRDMRKRRSPRRWRCKEHVIRGCCRLLHDVIAG